jgi:hypothetical protein
MSEEQLAIYNLAVKTMKDMLNAFSESEGVTHGVEEYANEFIKTLNGKPIDWFKE